MSVASCRFPNSITTTFCQLVADLLARGEVASGKRVGWILGIKFNLRVEDVVGVNRETCEDGRQGDGRRRHIQTSVMTLQVLVKQELHQERLSTDWTRERLVVGGHVRRQLGVRAETLATEQTTERPGNAEVVHPDMKVPFHLRVENCRAAAAAVYLTLVAVLHREVDLDVHLTHNRHTQ